MSVMTPWGEMLTRSDSTISPGEYYDQMALLQRHRVAQGLGQVPPQVASMIQDLGRKSIKGLEIRTQITPTVAYSGDQFFDPPPSFSRWFLANVVKPEVTVNTALGPVSVAPYGPPTANYFAPIAALAALGVAGVGYFIYRGIRR